MKRTLAAIASRMAQWWPRASLRMYLSAALLLAITPIAMLLCWQIVQDVRSDQQRIEEDLSRSSASLSQSVQRELASSLEALTVLSQSELFQQGRIAALGRLLQGRPRRDWDSIFLLDRDGSIVLDTAVPHASAEDLRAVRELHARTLRQRGPSVSGGVGANKRGVAIALPILQGQGVRYVLGARMSESVWQRLMTSASVPPGARAALFDAKGRLLALSDADPVPVGASLPADAMQPLIDTERGVERSSDLDGQQVYAAWNRVPNTGWDVRVSLAAAPVDAVHRRAIAGALTTSGGSLLLGLVLAALVARRVARPLRQLATRGPGGVQGRLPVREVAALRDALAAAHPQEAADARGALDEVIAMLGHELRNPVGAIGAAVDVLEASDPASSTAAEAREVIGRQSRKLAHMLEELLDLGRVMTRRVELASAPVELAALVRKVADSLLPADSSGGGQLEQDLQPAWVNGDAVRLAQAMSHLLGHMMKPAHSGGPARVSVRREDGHALLTVTAPLHSGAAMADEQGIGLALVRRLVQLHGGTFAIEHMQQASRCTIRLPAIEPPAAPAPGAPGPLPASRRRKVLLVEGDGDERAALREWLELDGHAVTTAADGAQGLSSLLELEPEVSIVDVSLPGLAAYELARHARAAGYAGRMIALSGRGEGHEERDALVAGFDACLAEPVDRARLRACLDSP